MAEEGEVVHGEASGDEDFARAFHAFSDYGERLVFCVSDVDAICDLQNGRCERTADVGTIG